MDLNGAIKHIEVAGKQAEAIVLLAAAAKDLQSRESNLSKAEASLKNKIVAAHRTEEKVAASVKTAEMAGLAAAEKAREIVDKANQKAKSILENAATQSDAKRDAILAKTKEEENGMLAKIADMQAQLRNSEKRLTGITKEIASGREELDRVLGAMKTIDSAARV